MLHIIIRIHWYYWYLNLLVQFINGRITNRRTNISIKVSIWNESFASNQVKKVCFINKRVKLIHSTLYIIQLTIKVGVLLQLHLCFEFNIHFNNVWNVVWCWITIRYLWATCNILLINIMADFLFILVFLVLNIQ